MARTALFPDIKPENNGAGRQLPSGEPGQLSHTLRERPSHGTICSLYRQNIHVILPAISATGWMYDAPPKDPTAS